MPKYTTLMGLPVESVFEPGVHQVAQFGIFGTLICPCYIEVEAVEGEDYTKITKYGLQPHLLNSVSNLAPKY